MRTIEGALWAAVVAALGLAACGPTGECGPVSAEVDWNGEYLGDSRERMTIDGPKGEVRIETTDWETGNRVVTVWKIRTESEYRAAR